MTSGRVPLGTDRPLERTCGRWVGGTFGGEDEEHCGEPAVAHAFWNDDAPPDNSYVCAVHKEEAVEVYRPWRMHDLGNDCGMPGAKFFSEENVCRYDGEEVAQEPEVREPVEVA